MKVSRFLFFGLVMVLAILYSCEKEPEQLRDDIYYHEYDTPILMSSFDSVVGPADCHKYYPEESENEEYIDINNDGTNDLRVWYRTSSSFVDAYANCNPFDVYVLIYGLGNPSEITFEIAREGGFIGPLKTFEKKNIIDAQNDYGPNGVFYKISDSDDTYTFVGQRFLGIKMIEGDNVYFGYVEVEMIGYNMYLNSFALNRTVFNSIIAGQKN